MVMGKILSRGVGDRCSATRLIARARSFEVTNAEEGVELLSKGRADDKTDRTPSVEPSMQPAAAGEVKLELAQPGRCYSLDISRSQNGSRLL
jgi:hypothetical protein